MDKGSKGGRSLVCSNAKRGNGCSITTGWRYDHFETSFMTFVSEADLPAIMGELQPEIEHEALQRQIQEIEGRLIKAQKARERVFGLIVGDEPTEFLGTQLRRYDSEVAALQTESKQKTDALASLREARKSFDESKQGIADLLTKLQSGPRDELFKLRSTVAHRLKAIVDQVLVWPTGLPKNLEMERQLIQSDGERAREYLRKLSPPSKKQHAFAVVFKDGTNRAVSPDADDPTVLQWIGGTEESPLTAQQVRDYLAARYGATEFTPDDLQTGFEQLRENPNLYTEYGGDVIEETHRS